MVVQQMVKRYFWNQGNAQGLEMTPLDETQPTAVFEDDSIRVHCLGATYFPVAQTTSSQKEPAALGGQSQYNHLVPM